MKKQKKEIYMNGSLLRPIAIGQSALIQTDGKVYHTSRVQAIHEQTEESILFETLNSLYHLSMLPFPLAAISPLPVRLAACA
ncbi:hypothetical protein DS742_17465 [Lacrimispora amygdalina]|uniref:Uncharacterized protein n=1 Tax=Lacrimispora amygdalina TaxID=253257 RepID=A0A3E2N9K0_9FIRM|nr:hypothetical protein [Clostridium indicum]RFZ77604.1 hypothetical protein DS742_17465 [Clostridium indicum]